MRSRYPSTSTLAYSFGPGPLTPVIKALVIANVAAFVISFYDQSRIFGLFGLRPEDVVRHLYLWQPLTYMFLHGGVSHILFNMLTLWMFGVELERMWGSRFFLKYYFVAGVGAALTTIVLSFAPIGLFQSMYAAITVGASGAIYGVLLAYGKYFPYRPILFFGIFPIQARYFVMIMGAMSFLFATSGPGGGIAHLTHLGGLLAGYMYLKGFRGGRLHVMAEIKYRYLKWRINRMRRRFDVYSGGRADDVDRRVH